MKTRIFSGFLAVTLALAGCGPSQQQYDQQVARVRQLEAELRTLTEARDGLNRDLEGLRAQNTQLSGRLRELGQDVASAESERDAARRRAEELQRMQQQAEARLATFRQMLQRFQSMINSGQLRVRIVRGRMVIELPAGILFASGDARLQPAGQEVLRQVAQVLRQIPDRDFLIAGHTDNAQLGRGGRFSDNWDLSAARAVNVTRFLQQNGLEPAHLGAAGYAEFQPAAANDTDENRQLNRRVEIVLMPNINELPDLSSLEGSTGASAAPSAVPSAAPSAAH